MASRGCLVSAFFPIRRRTSFDWAFVSDDAAQSPSKVVGEPSLNRLAVDCKWYVNRSPNLDTIENIRAMYIWLRAPGE